MGRPRTGHLSLRNGVWHAQLTVGKGDAAHRELYNLGTADDTLARRKLARLQLDIEDGKFPTADATTPGPASERVDDYAEAWFEKRKARGVQHLGGDKINFRLRIKGAIGGMYLCDVKPIHIRGILDRAIGEGLRHGTIVQIRNLLHNMLRAAWREELIESNPVDRVEVPKMREVVKPRCILTDDEFCAFMACDRVDVEIKMMSLVARTLGGMRKSDVVRWDWSMIDRVDFAKAFIPRSKTGRPEALEVPAMVRPFLRARWEDRGQPAAGPVFPIEIGPNAGKPRKIANTGGIAERLRRNLFVAGVVRLPPVIEPWIKPGTRTDRGKESKVPTKLAPNPADPLYFETSTTMPVDFHSFRRAYATALAEAGVNAQQAMHLAGHSNAKTHARYVMHTAAMGRVPEAALPKLLMAPVAIRCDSSEDSQKQASSDSNIAGSESDVLSQNDGQNGAFGSIDTVGVAGSTPVAPTRKQAESETEPDRIATARCETPRDAPAVTVPTDGADALEAALLTAARAGDALTVARLTELMHARMLASAGVATLDSTRLRR